MPEYFTVAKTFLLSKEDTPFPKHGNVRIIAVLPSILKFYEQLLLKNLRSELERTTPLHERQRGFVAGKCTTHNIADVVKIVNRCKKEISSSIKMKVPAEKRPKYYMLFIDLAKAFDSIDRSILISTMKDRGINDSLVKAFSNMLASTSMLIDGQKVATNIGVMQGAVTSPVTFALYIDDLLNQLNKTSEAFALADDLVCICKGDL